MKTLLFASARSAFLVIVFLPPPTIAAEASPQDEQIYPGETVVVVKEKVEFGMRDKEQTLLSPGAKIEVTEVRAEWIGGYTFFDGKRIRGWLNRNEVKLELQPGKNIHRIDAPDQPDDAKARNALQSLKVVFELNARQNVHVANAADSRIGDDGLVHFQGLHQLATLELSGRPITDAGLKRLGPIRTLQNLYLDNTQVTDAGLESLKGLENLEALALNGTKVKGTGLVHLVGLKHLRVLNLGKCPITDEDLAHVGKITTLEVLALPGSKVTSAGLAQLVSLVKLRVLNLIDCAVEDTGLEHLTGFTELRMLYVKGTKVTPEGSSKLKTTMPSVAIFRN